VFLIPGWAIALLTFPGVICHEIAHRFFCDISKVPVYAVSYFGLGNPAGYVIHAPAEDLQSAFLISIGPLIVNTILCAFICFSAIIPSFILQTQETNIISVLLIWVGISIGMHAFPSSVDMDNFNGLINRTGATGIPRFAGKFCAGLFAIANALRFFWFDCFYALFVALALPWLVLGLWGWVPES
jgi:hypothetical protein